MGSRALVAVGCVVAAVSIAITAPPALAVDVASQTCTALPSGPAVSANALTSFVPVTPRRFVDTRDGTGGVGMPVGGGCTLQLDLNAASLPVEAEAVALSVTALSTQSGFLTVFPCSAGRPDTSNLNPRAGRIPTPNLVVAIPDENRRVCVYSLYEADLIVDMTGWWAENGAQQLRTIPPVRADDSRNDAGGTRVAGDTTRIIALADIISPDATAVVGNLTVASPNSNGFMTAYACDGAVPTASNLNFRKGESRAVAVVVGVDHGANLCVHTSADAHIVFDVSGYYRPAPQFGPVAGLQPIQGVRVADSRDGQGGWNGKFAAGEIRRLNPISSLPDNAQTSAALVNVVVTKAEGNGFLSIYPCGDDVPDTSSVNFTAADRSTNMVVVDLSTNGEICVFTTTAAHIVVDLFGVLRAPDDALVESLVLDAYTWPDYRPDATDYAVECSGNSTEVSLELLRSTSARLNGVPVGSSSVELPTAADRSFQLELRRGTTVQNLSFRCVPDGFPRLAVERPGEPTPGWYVTTTRVPGSSDGYAVILDHFGAPVWYKRVPGGVSHIERRPDGRMLSVSSTGPRYGVDPERGYLVSSLFGTVIDELTTVPDPAEPSVIFPTDHHEMLEFPDGGRAALSYPLLPHQDLTVLGAGYLADDVIADGVIQEIASDDSLIWSWRTSDHFGYDVSYPVRWGPRGGYDGTEVDIYHLNSLDRVDDGSGDYIVSARHMDNVFRIDRATGDVDWVLGDVAADSPAATLAAKLDIVGDPRGGPRRSHDARLDGNTLTLFDNRHDTGEPARAVAYEINDAARTATLLWEIEQEQGLSSFGLGSTRVAADGSVLISWGAIQPVFGEYAATGEAIMEISMVRGGVSYRIQKEPMSAFSRDVLRATAGGSLNLP